MLLLQSILCCLVRQGPHVPPSLRSVKNSGLYGVPMPISASSLACLWNSDLIIYITADKIATIYQTVCIDLFRSNWMSASLLWRAAAYFRIVVSSHATQTFSMRCWILSSTSHPLLSGTSNKAPIGMESVLEQEEGMRHFVERQDVERWRAFTSRATRALAERGVGITFNPTIHLYQSA